MALRSLFRAFALLGVTVAISACNSGTSGNGSPGIVPQSLQAPQSVLSMPATTPVRIYVANGNNSIIAYSLAASGNVKPAAMIGGSNTKLNEPCGIAFDGTGKMYVTNFSTNTDSVTEYAAGAIGNVAPVATIAGSNTSLANPCGIAASSTGKIYVVNEGGSVGQRGILEFSAAEKGNVKPVVTISGSNTGMTGPHMIAVDSVGNTYVTNVFPGAVVGYPRGSKGNVAPVPDISGSNTTLTTFGPYGIARDASGNIYVADYNGNDIARFDNTNGNIPPNSEIVGPNTLLNGPAGLALHSGKLYVTNSNSSTVTVYPASANGNVAPIAIIVGPNTQLNSPVGIVVH